MLNTNKRLVLLLLSLCAVSSAVIAVLVFCHKEEPMGLWDRIRSALSKKAASSSVKDGEQPEMITVYDKFGRKLVVTKQEWQRNVLPGQIGRMG